ncbi:MAG: MlaD family protein [Planctomycetota bacterium]|nr:MlaD family protein [Planctomycetota bacterium]
MKNTQRDFIIGLVVIMALVCLSVLLLQFGELDRLINPTYPIQVKLNAAGTTRIGSAVTLNGVRIGTVSNVELVEDPEFPVLVGANVERRYPLPLGTRVRVSDALIGSGGRLDFVLPIPPDPAAGTYAMDGSAVLEGRWLSMTESLTSGLEDQMQPVMDSLSSFNTLAGEWTGVGERVNWMLDPANRDSEGSVIATVEQFESTLADARTAITYAQQWLGDEQLRTDVSAAVWKANELFQTATQAVGNISNLATMLEDDGRRLLDSAIPVAEEMSVTLERVTLLMNQAATGEGTIGQLMTNPDLYRSLEDAAQRLEATLAQLELLLQKIRDEGLAVGF